MHVSLACRKIRVVPQGIFLSRQRFSEKASYFQEWECLWIFIFTQTEVILYLQWSGLNGTLITNRIITLLWISVILPFATLVGMKRKRWATELMKGLEEISVVGGWGLWACLDWTKGGEGWSCCSLQLPEEGKQRGRCWTILPVTRHVGTDWSWTKGDLDQTSRDLSSPRWWSNTGSGYLEKWSMFQIWQCLSAFGHCSLTTHFNFWSALNWSDSWTGWPRFFITEIISSILKSLKVNPD